MRRKLIKHGESSLTISLPSKWIKENNLKKGNEIEIEEINSDLVITTKKHYQHKKINIDIANSQPMIRKIIGATFKSGYDEIDVKFNSFEELKAVQELVREQFSGFEIINQSKNNLTIKNLSETSFEEFPNVLRRFFLVLNHMASETSLALDSDDFNWLKNTTLLKIESDKFADYLRRAINMNFQTEYKRCAPLYTIIEQLEKVVDRYKELCEYTSNKKIKTSKNIKTISNEIKDLIEEFYQIFYKYDTEKLVDFTKKKNDLQIKIYNSYITCSKPEIKILSLFDRILNLIYDLNGPLMATYI